MFPKLAVLTIAAVSALADQPDPRFSCVHAAPNKSILAPDKNQSKSTLVFRRLPEAGNQVEAEERWKMDDSTSVQIFQSGCEDLLDTYIFVVSGDTHNISDQSYWFSKASSLLRRLPVKRNNRLEIAEMAKAVDAMARRPKAFPDGRKEVVKDFEFVGIRVKARGSKTEITIDYEIDL